MCASMEQTCWATSTFGASECGGCMCPWTKDAPITSVNSCNTHGHVLAEVRPTEIPVVRSHNVCFCPAFGTSLQGTIKGARELVNAVSTTLFGNEETYIRI